MTMQPREDEQRAAEELDRLIGALQRGQSGPGPREEKQLVQQLLQYAADVQPEQTFTNSLRARLVAQANRKSPEKKGAALLRYIEEWAENLTMKRTIISLAGVTALFAVVLAGWLMFRALSNNANDNDNVAALPTAAVEAEAESAEQPVPTGESAVNESSTGAETPEATAALEQPAPEQEVAEVTQDSIVQGIPRGFGGGGGGGGYGFGEGQGPFTEAEVSLAAELPGQTETMVYQAPAMNGAIGTLDLAQVQAFAATMGVNGSVYFDWYAGLPVDGQDDGSGNVPTVYRVFEGKRQVTAYLSGEMYYEDTSLFSLNLPPLPFAERSNIAEQYLLERNLLDFAYQVHPGWGGEVQFLEVIDGQALNNWAKITVNVAGNGQVVSVSIRPLTELSQLQNEAIRPAAEAWQWLQENFQTNNYMFNIIASDPAYYAPSVTSDTKTHWDLEYVVGQEVALNSWIQIFRPVDGSATPRLTNDRGMILVADNDTLESIAQTATNGNNIRLQGVVGGEPNALVLNVTSWEPINGPSDMYLSGTTRLIDGVMHLELPGGFPIEIANAPADLPQDTAISMLSWSVRVADDGVSAITDWVMIDLLYNVPVDSGVIVEDPFSNISGVNITTVELVYQYLYPYEAFYPYSQVPLFTNDFSHLVPAWRFTGTTNKGDLVEFIVPALVTVELPVAVTE